jgi:TPR repeat protein
MKTTLFFLLISATCVFGQNASDRVLAAHNAALRQSQINQAQEAAAEAAANRQLSREARQAAILRNTLESHPWRAIDGVTQQVNGAWCAFSGTISHVAHAEPGRVIVIGEFHPIYPGQGIPFAGRFVVKNYPYQAADGDPVPNFMAAKSAGVIDVRAQTIHCLDFGVICAAPGTSPEEIAAAKKAGDDKALAANEDAAAHGDPYGLLRMGERYRDGDGVETNLDLARGYLTRAAAAGDLMASNELVVLPPSDPPAAKP